LAALGFVLGHGGCGGSCSQPVATEESDRVASPNAVGVIPDGLGIERGVVIIAGPELTAERVYARGDTADIASEPAGVVGVITLLAGFRSGMIDANARYRCTGYNCWRAHGEITPAQALALGCDAFFEDLAARLGSDALAPAFNELGLSPPPIPVDPVARVRLAAHSDGWSITPRAALRLARAMMNHPTPWYAPLDEALVPQTVDTAGLHGKAGGTTDRVGWFVGFVTAPQRRLVVSRVAGCSEPCAIRALRLASWALGREQPSSRATPPPREPAAPAIRRRH
jgi:beta-lactamase class D